MRVRALIATTLLVATLSIAGCGGDNIALCDGCGTPVPSVTPTSTAPTPTATLTGPVQTATRALRVAAVQTPVP